MSDGTEPGDADLVLRPAVPEEVAALVEVQLLARRAAAMPAPLRGPGALRDRWKERLSSSDEVWVAELQGEVVGCLLLTETWLDDLYVLPSTSGRGVGSALLDLAKSLRPRGFGLYVLEGNDRALGFYLGRGLVVVAHHPDGGGADAREEGGHPDVELTWEGDVGPR
ncbi:MAG: GNAT family N-acetyltransferase [Nocardioides sp.]|nr:GNAT family N-acetyltransferase [Nocardioides sp.]